MYEYLQALHLIVFLPLLFVKSWRSASVLLAMSAIIYLCMEPQFDYWNSYKNISGYLYRGVLDGAVARMCWHWCGAPGKIQGAILAVSGLVHVWAALELYTQLEFMYNHWVGFTRALNILQLLVASDGVFQLTANITKGMGMVRRSGDYVDGLPGYRFGLLRTWKEN